MLRVKNLNIPVLNLDHIKYEEGAYSGKVRNYWRTPMKQSSSKKVRQSLLLVELSRLKLSPHQEKLRFHVRTASLEGKEVTL